MRNTFFQVRVIINQKLWKSHGFISHTMNLLISQCKRTKHYCTCTCWDVQYGSPTTGSHSTNCMSFGSYTCTVCLCTIDSGVISFLARWIFIPWWQIAHSWLCIHILAHVIYSTNCYELILILKLVCLVLKLRLTRQLFLGFSPKYVC